MAPYVPAGGMFVFLYLNVHCAVWLMIFATGVSETVVDPASARLGVPGCARLVPVAGTPAAVVIAISLQEIVSPAPSESAPPVVAVRFAGRQSCADDARADHAGAHHRQTSLLLHAVADDRGRSRQVVDDPIDGGIVREERSGADLQEQHAGNDDLEVEVRGRRERARAGLHIRFRTRRAGRSDEAGHDQRGCERRSAPPIGCGAAAMTRARRCGNSLAMTFPLSIRGSLMICPVFGCARRCPRRAAALGFMSEAR